MYLLMTQDTLPLNEASISQYFIFDKYTEMVYQDIMPDTDIAKSLIARKCQFKAL